MLITRRHCSKIEGIPVKPCFENTNSNPLFPPPPRRRPPARIGPSSPPRVTRACPQSSLPITAASLRLASPAAQAAGARSLLLREDALVDRGRFALAAVEYPSGMRIGGGDGDTVRSHAAPPLIASERLLPYLLGPALFLLGWQCRADRGGRAERDAVPEPFASVQSNRSTIPPPSCRNGPRSPPPACHSARTHRCRSGRGPSAVRADAAHPPPPARCARCAVPARPCARRGGGVRAPGRECVRTRAAVGARVRVRARARACACVCVRA